MNMQNIMAQAQKMQNDILKKKTELENMEFDGKSEFVNIIINGKKEIVKLVIEKDSMDKEDIEMLQDLIIIAEKEALKKYEKEYNLKLGNYGSSLNGLI